MASALTVSPDETPRGERIAHGILLVQQGLTYQEAGRRAGVAYVAIWRAMKRLEDGWASEDANAQRRAMDKAQTVCEMILERMASDVDRCPPSVLATWGTFAAKVAGWEAQQHGAADGGGDAALVAILDKLGKGGRSVRVGVEIGSPSSGTQSTAGDCGIAPNSLPMDCRIPAHTPAPTNTPQTTLLGPVVDVPSEPGE